MLRFAIVAIATALISSALQAQSVVPQNNSPPPPPSMNGQPPAMEIPRQPTPIPPLSSPVAGVDQPSATVFDCERLARLGQALPLDCRSRALGR
jgi:hypothetical protein